jgi:hypothetical protein
MDEETFRRGRVFVIAEKAYFIAYGTRAEPRDADARRDDVGKRHLREITAAGFDDQADILASMRITPVSISQPFTAVSNSE